MTASPYMWLGYCIVSYGTASGRTTVSSSVCHSSTLPHHRYYQRSRRQLFGSRHRTAFAVARVRAFRVDLQCALLTKFQSRMHKNYAVCKLPDGRMYIVAGPQITPLCESIYCCIPGRLAQWNCISGKLINDTSFINFLHSLF